MPSTDYDLDKELEKEVIDMIDDPAYSEFNELRELGVVVLPCVRVRMDADGESQPCKGDPVTVKKVNPVDRLFMPKKPHFIMIVDYHAWSGGNPKLRKAILHRGLMRVTAEKTDDGGVKLCWRKPDVVEFTRTIERFGAFTDSLLNCRDAFRNATHRILPNVEGEPEEQPEVDAESQEEENVDNDGDNT